MHLYRLPRVARKMTGERKKKTH